MADEQTGDAELRELERAAAEENPAVTRWINALIRKGVLKGEKGAKGEAGIGVPGPPAMSEGQIRVIAREAIADVIARHTHSVSTQDGDPHSHETGGGRFR